MGEPRVPTHLAVTVTVQEVIADVGLHNCLSLLPRLGCSQTLEEEA